MHGAIRRLRRQRPIMHCVGITAAVQQEVLVLHVRKAFRVEGHADKVEIGVEAMDLEGILDVVSGRAVAIVIRILTAACCTRIHCGHRVAAEDISRAQNTWARTINGPSAGRARIHLLRLERGIKRRSA